MVEKRVGSLPDTSLVRRVKVHPEVWAAALRAADGDARRLTVVDETTVLVD